MIHSRTAKTSRRSLLLLLALAPLEPLKGQNQEATLPTPFEAEQEINEAINALSLYNQEHVIKIKPIDWERYIRTQVQPFLFPTGHGRPHQNIGTIHFSETRNLQRTLSLHPLNYLKGKWRPGWDYGSSCGFRPSNDFQSKTLIQWEHPAPRKVYQNFCMGASDVFALCRSPDGKKFVNGINATLSQQAELKNIRVKGFGKGNTGLTIAGDVWTIKDCVIDRDTVGQTTPPKGDGSVGIQVDTLMELVKIKIEQTTIHNCEKGLVIHNVAGGRFDMETETTRYPFVIDNHSVDTEINARILHADALLVINKATHNNFEVRLKGHSVNSLNKIILPDGKEHWVHPWANSKNAGVRKRARSKRNEIVSFDVRVYRHGTQILVEDLKRGK